MQFRVSDHRLCRSDTYNINCKSYLHTKCRIPIQISLPNANMFPHIISQIHVFGKCFHRFYRIRALLIRALLIRALLLRAVLGRMLKCDPKPKIGPTMTIQIIFLKNIKSQNKCCKNRFLYPIASTLKCVHVCVCCVCMCVYCLF